MKKNYENHEEFELVIKKCEEELMRQVSVECKHRGEILTIILNYYKQHKNQKYGKLTFYFEELQQVAL